MDTQLLKQIREYEVGQVVSLMPQGSFVLEIGAGAGWQAKHMVENGFVVEAIDLKQSNYSEQRIWPVMDYDGVHIPFADNSFDFVFSSNVLEHIAHIEDFQIEIQRVLKPDGTAIHILPTATWRFWTNISFYMVRAKQILSLVRKGKRNSSKGSHGRVAKTYTPTSRLTFAQKVIKAVLPAGHGAIGNCMSELYSFSRFRWISLFKSSGWSITMCKPTRLLYTGHLLCGSKLNIPVRHAVSYVLGSSCLTYVLTKN
jgi:SAM-dependent methyltransferase